MAIDFQIQEMIHQDADGVLFQALDKQTGHLVALRRFFLPEEALAKLKEEGEDGKCLFLQHLESLKSLDIPHLQKVVGGGIDALDDTPYFVAEWIEGKSLAVAHGDGIFFEGEGEVFEAQARAVLEALSVESRAAVWLDEEEILVSRDDTGVLRASFMLSPRRYFGAIVGMGFVCEEPERALSLLRKRFPARAIQPPSKLVAAADVLATPMTRAPVLKGGREPSGKGLFWGALGAFLVLLGVGGWFAWQLRGRDENAVKTFVSEVTTNEEEGRGVESELGEVAEKVESEVGAEWDASDEESVADADTEAEAEAEAEVAGQDAEVERKLEEAEEVALANTKRLIVEEMAEAEDEGLIEVKEVEKEVAVGDRDYYTPDDLAALKEMDGEQLSFRGKVVESGQSGSGKTWYLDFGDKRFHPFVVFLHTRTSAEEQKEDWEKFVGQEIVVNGKVEIEKGMMVRGSGVKIVIRGLLDISSEPEEPQEAIYQFADLDDLRVVSKGEKVIFEGDFKGFGKSGESVYLLFEEGRSIMGRFAVGGPLSTKEFAKVMNGLKGRRVRLTGVREEDERSEVEVVIQLDDLSGFVEAP